MRFAAQANWNFNGSALNAPQKQLRSDVPVDEAPYSNNNFRLNLQGPVKIPGIYKNPNNRTRFTLTVYAARGAATCSTSTPPSRTTPSAPATFSALPVPVIDPQTGLPFPDNKIPADRISPQALALFSYYPAANLPGTTRNYHYSTSTGTHDERLQPSGPAQLQRPAAATAAAAAGGRQQQRAAQQCRPGRTGPAAARHAHQRQHEPPASSTTSSEGEQLNVFTTLGGYSRSTSARIQDSFNIQRGRTQHQISVNYNRSEVRNGSISSATRPTSSELIGIQGISTDDPFSWGLPRLSFSSISGLSDVTPSLSKSDRFNASTAAAGRSAATTRSSWAAISATT